MSRLPISFSRLFKLTPISLVILLTLPGMAAVLDSGPVQYPASPGVLDPYLMDIMKDDFHEGEMEVLVQFRDHPIGEDIEYARGFHRGPDARLPHR